MKTDNYYYGIDEDFNRLYEDDEYDFEYEVEVQRLSQLADVPWRGIPLPHGFAQPTVGELETAWNNEQAWFDSQEKRINMEFGKKLNYTTAEIVEAAMFLGKMEFIATQLKLVPILNEHYLTQASLAQDKLDIKVAGLNEIKSDFRKSISKHLEAVQYYGEQITKIRHEAAQYANKALEAEAKLEPFVDSFTEHLSCENYSAALDETQTELTEVKAKYQKLANWVKANKDSELPTE
jgi:hypothetical protein